MDEAPVTLGWLKGKVETLEGDVREIRLEVKAIRTTLDIQKGGWRVLIALTSAAATLGATVAALIEWATRRP